MPQVDLGVGNSIIQAYLAGQHAALSRKELQQKTEHEAAVLEEQKKEHEEALAQANEHFKATQGLQEAIFKINSLQAKQAIGKEISTTGIIPPGASNLTAQPQNAPIPTNLEGTTSETPPAGEPDYLTIHHPDLGTFKVPSPSFAGEQAGKYAMAAQAPVFKRQEEAEKARFDREQAIENLKTKSAESLATVKQAEENLKFKAQIESNEKIAAMNNAARLAAARLRGENDKVTAQALRVSNQFDTHDITKRYNMLKEAAQTVNSIPDNTNNPADDQQLIYAFAKAMDPNSVVREGEYNTVQRYSQTIADRLGFAVTRLTSNTHFLTPEAVKNIKATVTNRAKIEEGSYNNLRQQTAKKLATIGAKPENYLVDYGQVQEDRIRVKRKSDGAIGNILSKDFDPAKYEKAPLNGPTK